MVNNRRACTLYQAAKDLSSCWLISLRWIRWWRWWDKRYSVDFTLNLWNSTHLSKTSCWDRKWNWHPAKESPLSDRSNRAHSDIANYDRNCLRWVMWLQCFCTIALHWTMTDSLEDPVEWSKTNLLRIRVDNVYLMQASNIQRAIAENTLKDAKVIQITQDIPNYSKSITSSIAVVVIVIAKLYSAT